MVTIKVAFVTTIQMFPSLVSFKTNLETNLFVTIVLSDQTS